MAPIQPIQAICTLLVAERKLWLEPPGYDCRNRLEIKQNQM
jgi:hypothetical protein